MKATVNRQLTNGQYIVRFTLSEFSPDELVKMNSFGIPVIQLSQMVQGIRRQIAVPITQINPNMAASFSSEQDANQYQESVMNQIRQAMVSLRERKDDFTSTQEVNI